METLTRTFPDHLTTFAGRLAAASLEIDGRPDYAAEAATGGHVTEFIYAGQDHRPLSGPAIRRRQIEDAIRESITARGITETVAALRSR